MDDPRLLNWLELTRRALEASDARVGEVLQDVSSGRAELQRSLEESPPISPPRPELTRQLQQAQAELETRVGGLREQIEKRLAELRQVRSATAGYRPARTDTPAFLSKSV